jgi:fumarate hydratase class II
MDATPVTLGQEFSGYASLIKERTKDIQNALDNVRKTCNRWNCGWNWH